MEFISQIATKVHQFSFTSHVLTQIQVYESQKEGLIPSNIDVLLDRIIMSYPSSDSTFGSGGNLSPRFLESIGIKESFFTQRAKGIGNAICCDSIHITDFYLIHCTGYLGKNFAPPKLTFIP